jgi:hypothetical protein
MSVTWGRKLFWNEYRIGFAGDSSVGYGKRHKERMVGLSKGSQSG